MSFWESDLGEVTGKAEDAFAKTFTQIPDGTMALAKIDAFINAEYQGNKYLSIDWLLTDGDFKGQKVNQKLKVYGDPMAKDSSKARHRALNMLKLIYQLYNTKPKHSNDPTDQDLAVFVGKAAGIKIRETEPNEKGIQYNWVAEIHEAKGFKCETGIKLEVTHNVRPQQNDLFDSALSRNRAAATADPLAADMEDDIPF
jgi:hypothetical protein